MVASHHHWDHLGGIRAAIAEGATIVTHESNKAFVERGAMTHHTDVSNSWERETEDPAYFYQFSIDGYALGINVLLYAMTH